MSFLTPQEQAEIQQSQRRPSTPARSRAAAPASDPPKAKAPTKQGWWDWAGGVAKGTLAGVVRAAPQALGGVADFSNDLGRGTGALLVRGLGKDNAALQSAARFSRWTGSTSLGKAWNKYVDPDGDGRSEYGRKFSTKGANLGRGSDFSQVGNRTANQLSTDVLSIGLSLYAGGSSVARIAQGTGRTAAAARAATATGKRKFASTVAGGGIVEGVILDPEQERLSNFAKQLGVDTELTNYLAYDDKDGRLEGRFKAALEGGLVGAGVDTVLKVAKYWKTRSVDPTEAESLLQEISTETRAKIKKESGLDTLPEVKPSVEITKEEALKDRLDEAFDNHRELYPEKKLPKDTDPAKPPIEKPVRKEGTRETFALDANAALERAGVKHRVSPKKLDIAPDGRIRVPRAAKEALDKEGLGRAFVDKATPIPEDLVNYRLERSISDERTVLSGSLSRADLKDLTDEAQAWMDMADGRNIDITREVSPRAAARVGEFRLGNMGSGPQARAYMRTLAERLPQKAVRSDEELARLARAAADSMGTDPTTMLAMSRSIRGRVEGLDVDMATINTTWSRLSDSLDEKVTGITDWEAISDDMFDDIARHIREAYSIGELVKSTRSDIGRAQRAAGKMGNADVYKAGRKQIEAGEIDSNLNAVDPEKGIAVLPTTRKEMQQWAETWQMTKGRPELRQEFLQRMLDESVPGAFKYNRQALADFFTASILSGPTTIALNLVGPSLQRVLRTFNRTGGALRGAVGLSRQDREQSARVLRATALSALSFRGSLFDSFSEYTMGMKRSWNEGHSVLTGRDNRDLSRSGGFSYITENLLVGKDLNAGQQALYGVGNLINFWPRKFQKLSASIDDLGQRITYMSEVRLQAFLDADQLGIAGRERDEFVRDRLKSSVDDMGKALDTQAAEQAQRTSFLNPVAEPGSRLRNLSNQLTSARAHMPELRYVMPIFNTPANALGDAFATLLSPLELLGKTGLEIQDGIGLQRTAESLQGKHGDIAQAEAHGRLLTGTLLGTLGFSLVNEGLLTGAGPSDPSDRQMWQASGYRPYSIRIGDQWVDYRRYDSVGAIFSIPATIMDKTIHRRDDQSVEEMMLMGFAALGKWTTDRASMQTVTEILGSINNQDRAVTVMSKLGKRIAAGFIPAPVRTTAVQATDPYERLATSWQDYIKAATPGLSQELPPRRNMLGEPIARRADTTTELFLPVAFSPVNPQREGDLTEELYNIYMASGYGPGNDPQTVTNGSSLADEAILENGMSLASEFSRLRGTVKVEGKTIAQALNKIVKSQEYKDGVYGSSSNKTDATGKISRSYLVANLFKSYNKAAREELARTSPIAEKYMVAAKLKKTSKNLVGQFTVDELVDNPDLAVQAGISKDNLEGYRQDVRGEDSSSLSKALGLN